MSSNVEYLLSLGAIRERAAIVGEAAKSGGLQHFDLHDDKIQDVAKFVANVIKRDFGPDKFDTIPPHGRWQHFEVGGIPRLSQLMNEWKKDASCDDIEITRRFIDLFFVSVLLDAGAGDTWRYTEPATGQVYQRSEGIAVASLDMFKRLTFTSSNDESAPNVDGRGLKSLENQVLVEGFQVSDSNHMLGVESRATLLRSLGQSLLDHEEIFGPDARPGNLVDYLVNTASDSSELDVLHLWKILQTLLIPVWPKDRTSVDGVAVGDAWPLRVLSISTGSQETADSIQPFHKLTQWLTYSLTVPFQRILGKQWVNAGSLTALPEYRNGGLFVDLGVLTLKKESLERGLQASGGELPLFRASDDVVVEWRAMTLVLIDILHGQIQSHLGEGVSLSMAQLLEAGTWKSGREIAAKLRPETKSSPIIIESDGTVF